MRRRLTEHDGAWAVVGIEKGDLEVVSRFEFENGGCVQGDGFLQSMSECNKIDRDTLTLLLTRRFLRWRYRWVRVSKMPLA